MRLRVFRFASANLRETSRKQCSSAHRCHGNENGDSAVKGGAHGEEQPKLGIECEVKDERR